MASNKSGGIPVTNSMFACLKLEDEMEEEKRSKRRRNQQNQNNDTTSNKKKDDKKKKDSKESKQLQQLAFGKPGGSRKKSGKNTNGNNASSHGQNFDEWKQHDKEVVEDQFKNDLEKALLESQLQMEQDKAVEKERKVIADAGEEIPTTKEQRKKKKQKEKAKPMSLEEFKQLQPPPPAKQLNSDDSDEGEPSPPPVHYRVPTTEQDAKFFNNVKDEAKQILRQDKMQEDYRKTYAIDNAVVAKLKNDIEIRDNTITELQQQMEQMKAEMKQVKHRNKQLCVILAQGEMKDKAQVLLQVDDLNSVKDELTEQVTTLTAELEKEKSKNSALKNEADKLKGSKHGK